MHFSALTLFLPLTALASPFLLEARATDLSAAIIKNLTTTYNDVVAENNTLNQFADDAEPNFFQALALQQGGDNLVYDIQNTTKEANKTAVLTTAESTTIYNKLNNQLLPATQSLLKNFEAHYPGLNEQGLSGAIHTSLVQQRNLVQILGTSLTKKSTGAAKKNGPALINKFVTAFNTAIKKYAS